VIGGFGPMLAAAITIRTRGTRWPSGFARSFAGGYRFASTRTPLGCRC
jgi:hypothetical protein